MTKCSECGASVKDRMLHRVNPTGETGIWWCMECIEKKEPELAKNIKEDVVLKDFDNIFYNGK